jgi:putative transposase
VHLDAPCHDNNRWRGAFALRSNAPYKNAGWLGDDMPNYRRLRLSGGEYFFTVNLEDRASDALTRNIDALRAAWRHTEERLPFETVAAVVLPDHLHCIWKLPSGDMDFASRWRVLKTHFTRTLIERGEALPGRREGERAVWQRRFWEHAIRDQDDRLRHVDYIHNNPVKHGHCSRVDEWPYSTWRRWDAMIADDPGAADSP